ncbi:hypothetical protein B296_00055308, partial [Ensete ventricosum]
LHFLDNIHLRPLVVMLLGLRQDEKKTLSDRGMDNVHSSFMIQSFMMGLRPSHLFWSLVERTPTMVCEILQKVNHYIIVDAMVSDKCGEPHKRPRNDMLKDLRPIRPGEKRQGKQSMLMVPKSCKLEKSTCAKRLATTEARAKVHESKKSRPVVEVYYDERSG